MISSRIRFVTSLLALQVIGLPLPGLAELSPEWVAGVPVGASLSAGLQGMIVDPSGVSFVTGISGSSSNTDITTASFAADGSLLWSHAFNGPENWHDQGRGIAFGSGGRIHVVGNTPGPNAYSQVLLLTYDAASGSLLDSLQYSSGPFVSEHGEEVVSDAAGNIYIAGGTTGDGGDVLLLKLDAAGNLQWLQTWDGPASAPFSQDVVEKILIDPNGDPVVLIHGVMGSLHPDYVVVKYAATDGAVIWETNWGVSGEDSPEDMEIDASGDIYVTGTGLDLVNKFSTLKLRGTDGALLWQAYDSLGFRDGARALALDGQGGVMISGFVDPDGDRSNFNDQIYSVRRDSVTGGQLWTHLYGATCVGCFDLPTDVVVDSAGNVLVAGSTSSPPYGGDVILLVLNLASGQETDRGVIFGQGSEHAGSGVLALDATQSLFDGGETTNFDTGEVEMTVARWAPLVGQGAIPCAAVRRLQARCIAGGGTGNRLRVRLLLTDAGYDGESVTVEVDGAPHTLTVRGDRAQLSLNGALPGPHTIELTEPSACLPMTTTTCGSG